MKKIVLNVLLCSVAFVGLTACSSGNDSTASNNGESDTLVIYSPNSEGLINATIPSFEEKYGVKVELIQAGTGELFKKLESEKDAPVADIIFGGAYTLYDQNSELFEEYESPENENVIEEYRNATGYSVNYTLDGSCLIVNPELTEGITIESYQDLLNDQLKGKIASGDPANSSSALAQLTNILLAKGGYESEEAWQYVEELYTLVDGKISSSSSNVYKTVADGEMAVGLSYEDPTVKLLNDGANVEIVYPKEGTVFLPSRAAIIKDAKNMDNAQKFIDFILSKEVQDTMGTATTNRPVRIDAETSDNMKPLEEITVITEDYDYVSEHKEELVATYNDIFTKLQSQ